MSQFFHIRQLIDGRWDASNGTATDTNGRSRDLFNHTLCLQGVGHPRIVKFKGTFGNSFVTIAIRVDTRVTTVPTRIDGPKKQEPSVTTIVVSTLVVIA